MINIEKLNDIIEKYKPKFFVHGHVHKNYMMNFKPEFKLNEDTTVINGYERYIFEYPEEGLNDSKESCSSEDTKDCKEQWLLNNIQLA